MTHEIDHAIPTLIILFSEILQFSRFYLFIYLFLAGGNGKIKNKWATCAVIDSA
jgi:hypothetical protein